MKNVVFNCYKTLQQVALCTLPFAATLASDANAYERIISTAGNASEVIAELGQADKLVAVDTTSTKPADIMKNKPKIGYRRMLSAEGILSMTPDLLILAPDAGAPAAVKQLEASGLKMLTIKDNKTLNGVIADIKLIATMLDSEEKAKPMIDKIRTDEAEIKAFIDTYPRQPRIAFFMDGGIGRFMGLGKGTAGDGMIGIVGGKNVFASEFNSVRPVSLESLVASDIDMVVIASHRGKEENATTLTKALEKYPKLAVSKAGQNQCVFTIGIVEALGFGPNLTDAAKEIAAAVTPCLGKQ